MSRGRVGSSLPQRLAGSDPLDGLRRRAQAATRDGASINAAAKALGIKATELDPTLDGQHPAVDGGDHRGVVGFGLVRVAPGECA
jgi:hypothetical protein